MLLDVVWGSSVESIDCIVDIYIKMLCVKLCEVVLLCDLIKIYCGLGYLLEF